MKLKLSVPAPIQKRFRELLDSSLYEPMEDRIGSRYQANWPTTGFEKFESKQVEDFIADNPDALYHHFQESHKVEFELEEKYVEKLIILWQSAMYDLYTAREKSARLRGRRERFEESTDLEQFITLCRNLQGHDLGKAAGENEFILQDIQYELPKAIENLNKVLERAKALEPIAGAITPFKLKEGQSILFRFDRKYCRDDKKLVIGTLSEILDVKQKGFIPISLNYTMIYAYEHFEEGKLYTITNLGIHKPRRSHPGYNTFKIELVDESEIC